MSNRSHRRFAARRARLLGATGAGLAVLAAVAAPAGATTPGTAFGAGDLVVYRVGTGSAALTSSATPVSLDEYTTGGLAVANHALPTTATPAGPAVTSSGTATSEGELSLSTDGSTLYATGYNVAAGTSGSVAGTTSSPTANQRVAAEINAAGTVDSSTAFSALYSGNNIRSATGVSGSSTIYVGGPTNGVVATSLGSTTGTQLTPAGGVVNFRSVGIFAGQLYASSSSGTAVGINAIGSGLPTTSTTVTTLPGLDTTGSPYGFVLFAETGASPDTAYVADSTAGAILKYKLVGSTWTAAGSAGSTATAGVTGLTGTFTGGVATLYATSPSSLVSITDGTGQGTLTAAPTLLATAPTNEAFRGVAFAPASSPGQPLPESPLAVALPLSAIALGAGTVAFNRRRRTA